jgi:DNA polymerase-3 subunit epsilon
MLGLAAVSARSDLRGTAAAVRIRPEPLPPRLTDEEIAAHREFVATLGETAIWRAYWAA